MEEEMYKGIYGEAQLIFRKLCTAPKLVFDMLSLTFSCKATASLLMGLLNIQVYATQNYSIRFC